MTQGDIDTASVARAIARLVERPEDSADVFLEQSETVSLIAEGAAPGLRVRREDGLAVRMERDSASWIASADRLDGDALVEAVRRVARAQPQATAPAPRMIAEQPAAVAADDVLDFPSLLRRAIRERHSGVSLRVAVHRHRRTVQVIGSHLVSPRETETFYSVVGELPDGRLGALFDRLDEAAATRVARTAVRTWRCRDAAPPEAYKGPLVLAPEATAILLHETVAHALEADTLALGGHPEAAIGVPLAPASVNVLDDPTSAPTAVRRSVDDEGVQSMRRWLVREGAVDQPLCDRRWAATSERLAAGAGRRADRHHAPVPRSYHLELLPGLEDEQSLLSDAEGGLYIPAVSRGSLDPITGRFRLRFPHALRIHNRVAEKPVGPGELRGTVAEVLHTVSAIGSEVSAAGAGWCAKDGIRLPVWATVPTVRLEGLEVVP